MIPTTLSSACLFIALIAPGAIFEFTRNKVSYPRTISAFSEIVRVILVSCVFMLPAVIIVVLLTFWCGPELDSMLLTQTTVGDLILLLWLVLIAALIACLASAVTAYLVYSKQSEVDLYTVLYKILKIKPEKNCTDPYLIVRMKDGAEWAGYLDSFDLSDDENERYLLLSQNVQCRNGIGEPWKEGREKETIALKEAEWQYIRVQQVDRSSKQSG